MESTNSLYLDIGNHVRTPFSESVVKVNLRDKDHVAGRSLRGLILWSFVATEGDRRQARYSPEAVPKVNSTVSHNTSILQIYPHTKTTPILDGTVQGE